MIAERCICLLPLTNIHMRDPHKLKVPITCYKNYNRCRENNSIVRQNQFLAIKYCFEPSVTPYSTIFSPTLNTTMYASVLRKPLTLNFRIMTSRVVVSEIVERKIAREFNSPYVLMFIPTEITKGTKIVKGMCA